MNDNQRRCVDLIAEHAGVAPTSIGRGDRFEALGVRVPRLLAAIEEALTVVFDGDRTRFSSVGALLDLVATLPSARVYGWPPRDVRDAGASRSSPSTRGALERFVRKLRAARGESVARPTPTGLADVLASGTDGPVLLDGTYAERDGARWLDDVTLIGLPPRLRLRAGSRLRVEGWLRHDAEGALLEAFAVEALDQAHAARDGLHLDAFCSCADRDGALHTNYDVLAGIVGGHSVILALHAVGKSDRRVRTALRRCFERWAEADGDGSIFVRWDDAPTEITRPDLDEWSDFPTSFGALFAEVERRLVDTAEHANGGDANFMDGCVIVRDGARFRVGRTGLHRVVLVRRERVEVVAWEDSLRRSIEAAHPEAPPTELPHNIALSAFLPRRDRPPPIDVEVPRGARLVILSDDALALPVAAVERALLCRDPSSMATALAAAPALSLQRRHAILCIAPGPDAPPVAARPPPLCREDRAMRDECALAVRDGTLPRWVSPTPSHVARRLAVATWVTVDARHAADGRVEAPCFDGMWLDDVPGVALEEGELYRAEGGLVPPIAAYLGAPRLHPCEIEARRSSPSRAHGGFEARAHRGRIPWRDAQRRLVARPIARFDALLLPTAEGMTVVLLATAASIAAEAHERAREAMRARVPRGAPISLFTLCEGALRGVPPSDDLPDARAIDEVVHAIAPSVPDAVAALAATRRGLSFEARGDLVVGRVAGGRVTWLAEGTSRPLAPGEYWLALWGVAPSAPELASLATAGRSGLVRALELSPSFDGGDWGLLTIGLASTEVSP